MSVQKSISEATSAIAEELTSSSVKELSQEELEVVSGGGIIEDLFDALYTTAEIVTN